jgi:hypothetical protein
VDPFFEMHLIRWSIGLLMLSVISLASPSTVQAFPPLPSSFYGTVRLNGGNLPEDTLIEAVINDQVFASTNTQIYESDVVYSMIIPGDDPSTEIVEGGVQGDTIYFRWDGLLGDQTATWQSGTNTELDLMFTTEDQNPSSTATITPAPTQLKTLLSDTHTPEPSPTNQATGVLIQTPTPTPANSMDEEDQSSIKVTDENKTEKLSHEASSNTSTPTKSSNQSENDPTLTWLFIGIPSLILFLGAAGIWIFRSRSR